MTTVATAAALSEDVPDRLTNLEVQMQEIKDMIANLATTQTRVLSTPPSDWPLPTVEETATLTCHVLVGMGIPGGATEAMLVQDEERRGRCPFMPDPRTLSIPRLS